MSDQEPSDEVDTVAYAVSFSEAAKLLADTEWTDNHPLIVPFYMLIGFALENGLKAALEYRAVDKSLKWFHSHDLCRLRELAQDQGLNLGADADAFIEQVSPHHKEHHFRYPQKAEIAHLLNPRPAASLTNAILITVFEGTSNNDVLCASRTGVAG
jgi:hypothetical protein